MKTMILFLVVLIIPPSYSQGMMGMHKDRTNKLEQLERLKLIDVLNLNEETTLRFFARQKEFRNMMDINKKEAKKLLSKMQKLIKAGNKKNELRKTIESYLALGEKTAAQKSEFTKSLSDILTEEQIAKLLVFEMKFREDVRGLLFKMKRMPHGM